MCATGSKFVAEFGAPFRRSQHFIFGRVLGAREHNDAGLGGFRKLRGDFLWNGQHRLGTEFIGKFYGMHDESLVSDTL